MVPDPTPRGLPRWADAALLFVTAALVLTVALDLRGPVRLLLAIVFLTLVPGRAVLCRRGPAGGIVHLALVVAASLTICTAAATLMVWLRFWRPLLLLGLLAGGSAAIVSWNLWRPALAVRETSSVEVGR